MRLVISLAVVSAAAVLLGLALVVMSTAAHVVSRRPAGHVTVLGLALGAAGIAVGLVALLVAFTRAGGSTRGGSRQAGSDRRHPESHRHRAATSRRQERARAGVGAAEREPGQPPRDSPSRPRRDQILSPTTVYSPRDLLDVPRDARAPGSAGTPRTVPQPPSRGTGPSGPQDPRKGSGTPTAARGSRGGRREDPASAGRMGGPPPRPNPPPGAYVAGPGWGPPPAQAARQPQRPMGSPRDRTRSREAYPPRSAPPPREAPLPRETRLPRAAPPTESAMPRDSSRPGAPMPGGAFPPGYPMRFGQGQGSAGGRPPAGPGYASPAGPGYASPAGPGYASPAGPGYAPPGGPWPAPPGTQAAGPPRTPGGPIPPGARYRGVSGSAAPAGGRAAPTTAGPDATFDGGYAQVIRATDDPARPSSPVRTPDPGRPGGPSGPASPAPADPDVFVYRDPSARPAGPAADPPAHDPAEHDTAYWYDLLAGDTAPRREESRGPFEPLQSSSATSPGPGGAPTGTELPGTGPGQAPLDDTTQARARKLEQLKDLYLTAEAIGEENVDKHFDQLLAQQRELISEYFGQPAAARPAGPQSGHSGPAVASPRDGQAAEAEQPHAW
jgi:hypothetical protein